VITSLKETLLINGIRLPATNMVYFYWLIPEMLHFVPLHVSTITETAKVKIQVCYDTKGVKAVATWTR